MINEPSITTMQSERLGAEPIALDPLGSPHTTTPSPLTLFQRASERNTQYRHPAQDSSRSSREKTCQPMIRPPARFDASKAIA